MQSLRRWNEEKKECRILLIFLSLLQTLTRKLLSGALAVNKWCTNSRPRWQQQKWLQPDHIIYIDHRYNNQIIKWKLGPGLQRPGNKTVDYIRIQLENPKPKAAWDLLHNSWIIRLKTNCMIRSVSLYKVHQGLGCVFTRCEILL